MLARHARRRGISTAARGVAGTRRLESFGRNMSALECVFSTLKANSPSQRIDGMERAEKCSLEPTLFTRQFRCFGSITESNYDSRGMNKNKIASRSYGPSDSGPLVREKGAGLTASVKNRNNRPHRKSPLRPNRAKRTNPWLLVSRKNLEKETQRLIVQINEGQGRPLGDGKADFVPDVVKQDHLDVLHAWIKQAQTGGLSAAQSAESLLHAMENSSLYSSEPPQLGCYDALILAFSESGGGQLAAERAQIVLDHLLQNRGRLPQPTVYTFNYIIEAWAKSKSRDAGTKVEALLEQMKELALPDCAPNAKIIQNTMKVWSQSGHPQAPQRILNLLTKTIEEWMRKRTAKAASEPSVKPPPTLNMFHSAMGALAKDATKHNQRTPRKAAEQCEALLQLILDRQNIWKIHPNLRTYLIVLGCWERVEEVEQTGAAAQRAEQILDYMVQEAYKYNNSSSGESEACSVADTEKQIPQDKHRLCEPNTICFTSVMVAWCHAKQPQRAEDLYHRLVNIYRSTATNKQMLLPTTVAANAALSGWGAEGRPDRILLLMQLMQQVAAEANYQPECQFNLQTFNILLNAYSKISQPHDAMTLLHWLEGRQNLEYLDNAFNGDGDNRSNHSFSPFFSPQMTQNLQKPDIVSYSTVLMALAKAGLADKADALVRHMKRRGVEPTQTSYTSAIHSYSISRVPQRVAKAYQLLEQVMLKQKLDVICSTAFLSVCAHADPEERDLALDLALKVYEGLDNQERNAIFYKTMAFAANNLIRWTENTVRDSDKSPRWSSPEQLETERKQLIQRLARECCESGCLARFTLQELERLSRTRSDTVAAWLGSSTLQPEWSRNVSPRDRPKALQQDQ
jgi:pentatricopeptide repeat protein